MSSTTFAGMRTEAPDLQALADEVEALRARYQAAADREARLAAVLDWDRVMRRAYTWLSLAQLRFRQATTDAAARTERELADACEPRIDDLGASFKRTLLEGGHQSELAEAFGEHVLALWAADAAASDPSLEESLVEENRLTARYTALVAGAAIEFDGATRSLGDLVAFRFHGDRALRHAAESARWGWFAEQGAELDALFGELVAKRTEIARRMGHDDYRGLAQLRRHRIGYDPDDVARFRDEVVAGLVPVNHALTERRRQALGLERCFSWDEKVHAAGEQPVPLGDLATLTANAAGMFERLSPQLARFYAEMRARDLLDLESRDGKAFGGFCTWLADHEMPFVFLNANGSGDDVRVLVHEMGHAFQRWSSRRQPLVDTIGCTSELAEVHSMGLEFLAWPELEAVFGDQAESYRIGHLSDQLLFLPYGCAIDHFQELVYASPQASAADRHDMWRQMEARYLPHRDHGDLEHPKGAAWHAQQHVFVYPFYYIDYVLAATCALQFWALSRSDRAGAWNTYATLCSLGGTRSFPDQVTAVGLRSPFQPGCLDTVVSAAVEHLRLNLPA